MPNRVLPAMFLQVGGRHGVSASPSYSGSFVKPVRYSSHSGQPNRRSFGRHPGGSISDRREMAGVDAQGREESVPGRRTLETLDEASLQRPAPGRRFQVLESSTSVSDYLRRAERSLPSEASSNHSLTRALQFPGMFSLELMDSVIKRFTRAGDRILDPFCGTGVLGLCAQLQGRIAWLSDTDRTLLRLADAMTNPVGLDEVVLRIHQLPMAGPSSLSSFTEDFAPFFHPDTFFELLRLRDGIQNSKNLIDRFLLLLVASRLHGHTKSYFSTYTSPVFALSPDKQEEVNRRRRSQPEYRALAPRIIKRAAELLEDGIPGRFYDVLSERKITCSDARQLTWVGSNEVDMVFTAPPLPGEKSLLEDQWITRWFLGESSSSIRPLDVSDVASWTKDLSKVMSECLRVLRPGGFLALQLGKYSRVNEDGETELVSLEDVVAEVAEQIRTPEKRLRIHEMLVFSTMNKSALATSMSAATTGAKDAPEIARSTSQREPRVLVLRAQSYA